MSKFQPLHAERIWTYYYSSSSVRTLLCVLRDSNLVREETYYLNNRNHTSTNATRGGTRREIYPCSMVRKGGLHFLQVYTSSSNRPTFFELSENLWSGRRNSGGMGESRRRVRLRVFKREVCAHKMNERTAIKPKCFVQGMCPLSSSCLGRCVLCVIDQWMRRPFLPKNAALLKKLLEDCPHTMIFSHCLARLPRCLYPG